MTPPVAYPGPPGSHTASAAAALFPSDPLVPLAGFRAVADAVVSAEVGHGVLPIESSLAGPVAETHDLLYERALSIVGETVLPIRHCLAAISSVPLDEIRIVRSHPMALDQCRELLARLPKAKVILSATTAEAGQHVAEDGDPTEAAIVGAEAVSLYGLTVLADDVSDSPAFTRFVSIAAYTRIDRVRAARTAFTFATHHKPGALHAAIEPIARAGLDLVRLVSRPLPATPWKYRFDAVVVGHPLDPLVRVALRELEAATRELRVVGVYEGHEEQVMSTTVSEDPYVLKVRREISDLDSSLVALVNKRLKLVAQLKRYKEEHGIGFVDLAREEWMLQYLQRSNSGPMSKEGLGELYHYVLDLTKQEVVKQES